MRARLSGGLLVLPGVGWLLAFFLLPLLIIFVVSFGSKDATGHVVLNDLGLRNYIEATKPEFLPAFANSVRYSLLTTILSLVIGYPIAFWISRFGGRHKILLLILVMLPFWTSYLIRTYAWMIILRDNGVANSLLMGLGLTSEPIPFLNTDFSVVLGMTYGFLPFAILPLYVSIDRLDDNLVQAGRDLYASGRGAFLHVMLPLTMPGIIAAAHPDLHPGDGRLRDAGPPGRRPDVHDRQGRPGPVHQRPRLAVWLGVRVHAHGHHPGRHVPGHPGASPGDVRVRRGTNRWLTAFAIATYAFLFAPIVVLIIFSFNTSRRNFVWAGFTTDWYPKLFANDDLLDALSITLQVAFIAVIASTVIGSLLGLALARMRFRGRSSSELLVLLPMVTPEIIMGISLLILFSQVFGQNGSLAQITIAHITFCISYVAVVVRARARGMDPHLEEAARDLGSSSFGAFWHVTLPLIAPAVAAGAMLAFALSFDDLVVTSFNAGVGSTTLPIFIYSSIKFGVTPQINAISTIIVAVVAIALFIAWRLGTFEGDDRRRVDGEADAPA